MAAHSPLDAQPATHRRALSDPIKVAEFWKNRKGDTIRVSLETYEGHNLVSVRQFFTTPDGKLAPTKKGVSIAIARLPVLAEAINKALRKANEIGLLDEAAQ